MTTAALSALITLLPTVLGGRPVMGGWAWIPGVGLNVTLRLDGLALLFALLILGIGVLVATVCWLAAMTRAVATAKILYVDPAETDRPL